MAARRDVERASGVMVTSLYRELDGLGAVVRDTLRSRF